MFPPRVVQAGDKPHFDWISAVLKTMGIVVVAALAANAEGVPAAAIIVNLTPNQVRR